MEIKFHSMKEKPMISCDVIMAPKYSKPFITNYDKISDTFNYSEDCDTSVDTDNYIGWVYADDLFWQMVRCADEIQ